MDQLEFTRNAGETRRFHTWPVLREQNIAEHSWHVTMLLYLIFGQVEPGLTPTLLMAALTHDMAEHRVGDLPAPAKRNMDERLRRPDTPFRTLWGEMEQDILAGVSLDFEKFLEPVELQMLKLCDALDGALYCVRERAMGNQLIAEPYHNFLGYAMEILQTSFPVDTMVPLHHDRHGISVTPKTANDIAWEVHDFIVEEWNRYDS